MLALIASPKSPPGLGVPGALLPVQTSPRLVMASHHSSLALQKMKGPRNAFIPIAACVVTCLELSPAPGGASCAFPARGAAGGAWPRGGTPCPLWDRCRSHSPGHELHVHTPTAATWLPGLEFCCSRELCSMEGLAKRTPTFSFRLLPPPASEVSGAGLVPVSSFHPRSSSPAAQSPPQGSQKQVARKIIGKKKEGNRKIHFF